MSDDRHNRGGDCYSIDMVVCLSHTYVWTYETFRISRNLRFRTSSCEIDILCKRLVAVLRNRTSLSDWPIGMGYRHVWKILGIFLK